MSARRALKFKEKRERESIIMSKQPQVPNEPYHPGLMIEAQHPQTTEGISSYLGEIQQSSANESSAMLDLLEVICDILITFNTTTTSLYSPSISKCASSSGKTYYRTQDF